jgi:hypothetical protein
MPFGRSRRPHGHCRPIVNTAHAHAHARTGRRGLSLSLSLSCPRPFVEGAASDRVLSVCALRLFRFHSPRCPLSGSPVFTCLMRQQPCHRNGACRCPFSCSIAFIFALCIAPPPHLLTPHTTCAEATLSVRVLRPVPCDAMRAATHSLDCDIKTAAALDVSGTSPVVTSLTHIDSHCAATLCMWVFTGPVVGGTGACVCVAVCARGVASGLIDSDG